MHADVAVRAHRRDPLEHLCRSLVRPPLGLDRLTEPTGGQLLSQLRRPWSDGSTALLLDPLELLERLAALVPAPPVAGLPTASRRRTRRGAGRSYRQRRPATDDGCGRRALQPPRAPRRWSWATLLRRVFAVEVLVCPRCAGPRRILGAVPEPHAVQRRRGGLGLAAQPLPRLPVSAHV